MKDHNLQVPFCIGEPARPILPSPTLVDFTAAYPAALHQPSPFFRPLDAAHFTLNRAPPIDPALPIYLPLFSTIFRIFCVRSFEKGIIKVLKISNHETIYVI